MLRRVLVSSLLVVLVGLVSATCAKADDIFTYSINGNTYSWQLPSTLTISSPNMAVSGQFFELDSVAVTENGTTSATDILDFFSSSQGGGFELSDSVLLNEFGQNNQQLYTGSEGSPTFLPGTYTLLDATATGTLTGLTGTLVITSTGVPEPSSLPLIVIGFVGLLGLTWHRASRAADVVS